MAFWNEPTAPAWYGQEFPLSSGHISEGLIKPKKTTAEMLIEAASKLGAPIAKQMQQRKQDAIAQSLLEQEASPEQLDRYNRAGLKGVAAYQQLQDDQQGESQDVDKWYKRALEQRKLDQSYDPGAPTESIVQTPYGNMPASKYAALLNRKQPVDKAGEDWSKAIVTKRGFLDDQGNFTNKVPGKDANTGPYAVLQFPSGKSTVVPYSSYQEKVKPRASEGVATDAIAPSNGKQLDPATAQSILSEAGGDKDKARQIARQRGYTW